MAVLIVLAVIAVFVLLLLAKTVRVIPQARAGVVERRDLRAVAALAIHEERPNAHGLGALDVVLDRVTDHHGFFRRDVQ